MQGNVSKKCFSLSITVNPRSSPGGLIVVNFENLHGGAYSRMGLFEGGGLLKRFIFYIGFNRNGVFFCIL